MKLTFLAQIHKPTDGKKNSEMYQQVISSQFAVAKYLMQHPTTPVVDESMIAYENYKVDALNQLFIEAFPSGIPDKLEDLNPHQQGLFYRRGGTMIAYQLGYIKKVYGSIHPATLSILNATKDNDIIDSNYYCLYECEKEAISCVQEVVFDEEPYEVILVYSGGHDFSYYCEKLEYEYKRIDTSQELFSTPLIMITREYGEILRRLHDYPEPTLFTAQLINSCLEKKSLALLQCYYAISQPRDYSFSNITTDDYHMPRKIS